MDAGRRADQEIENRLTKAINKSPSLPRFLVRISPQPRILIMTPSRDQQLGNFVGEKLQMIQIEMTKYARND